MCALRRTVRVVAGSRSRRTIVYALVGLAALVAGCGDDAEETVPAGASASTTGVTAEPVAGSTSTPSTASVPSSSGQPTTVADSDTPTSDPSDESEAPVIEPSENGAGSIDPGVQPQIDLAIADLAGRLGVDRSRIETVSAAFVVWPDKGLGCPQHGMAYQQVQVDGTLVELDVDGRRYRYHSGETRPPFLCERTFSADPLVPDDSAADGSD